jgi:hypothetical protein
VVTSDQTEGPSAIDGDDGDESSSHDDHRRDT